MIRNKNQVCTETHSKTKQPYNRMNSFSLKCVLFIAFLFVTQLAFAQRTVSGTVLDANGDAVVGANIFTKESLSGTSADLDGNFSFNITDKDKTLQVSYIGYKTVAIPIGTQTKFAITLLEDVEQLEDVVVVGYGVQKKSTLTGSVSSVKGETLAALPVANISQSMAGKVSGVSMRPNSGQPGFDSPDIHIRGIVTTGNNKPLVVVDGIKRDNINQVNPSSIESITILKDAAATAPYGIGGANGVILITTKSGTKDKPVVRVSSSVGFQNPTYIPNMLNAVDYMRIQNEGYFNQTPNGETPPNDPALIGEYNELHRKDPYKYPDSRFTDQFNKNALMQIHNIELSGGTDVVRYHAGLGYFGQDGLFDPVNYNRFNYNISLDISATKTTKVGFSLHGSREHTNQLDPGENTTGGHLFRAFYKFIPTQALVYPGGDKWGESSANSPMAAINSKGYDKLERNVMLGTISIDQQLSFVKGLSVKGVFSYDPSYSFQKQWHIPFIYHKIDLSTQPYTFTEAITNQEGNSVPYKWLNEKSERTYNYTYQGYINYANAFGDHNVTGLLVAEGRNSTYNWFSTRRNNYAVDIDEIGMGSSNKLDFSNDGLSSTSSEVGFVYRVGYGYKDRYLIEASGRYDGHYYFAPGHRWGYFPSFSGAWRISEEQFFKNKFPHINNLKLRGSWGKSGMLAGSAFQYLSGYILRGDAYAFGKGTLVQGSRNELEANPNITWEISSKTDIGIDLNMWNGLLNVEFDYFNERRTGMLLAPQVIVPVEYGLALAQENKGIMENNGIELNLGTQKRFKNGMVLSVNANFSYAKNKMTEVFETNAERNNPNRTKKGRPFGTPYGFKSTGLFSTADDKNGDGIINALDGYNIIQFGELHPGDIRYADLSGPDGKPDGKIDAHDETVIGDPVYPLMTFGISPELTWKGFDLALFFQGSAMSSINNRTFLTVPFENNGSNFDYEYMNNRWTPDNQDAKYPRSTPSPYANNTKSSDFWIENTAFLRLKTITLGYTLPQHITRKIGIQGLRAYVVAQNLFTISGLTHIDPEIGYSNLVNSYPVMKSTNFGIDITF